MSERTIHFISLGCPKNRVDTEVMLGVARARAATGIVERARRGRGHRRQHLRLHRRRPRRSRSTPSSRWPSSRRAGSCKKLVVTGCLSQRYPEELAARDARGRPLPRLERHAASSATVLDGGDASACWSAIPPTGWSARPIRAALARSGAQRLREDRRGLQPHLLVLRRSRSSAASSARAAIDDVVREVERSSPRASSRST